MSWTKTPGQPVAQLLTQVSDLIVKLHEHKISLSVEQLERIAKALQYQATIDAPKDKDELG